ncbi:mechanosensitive ion channel family protein [Mesorhizobium sp. VK25A]|uniref:Small-conductance mechanosensitive channel n=2 Tax=Mesorhizobium vachelliae TaxID=3072309 RepID=A0ABU5AE86_9HYPH|nr:mechanosensitive ion channel family protein [Mesorhizobium sp. VK25A]MDX8535588.1 mechanosensitive ion channel family protein [Mesorhizobium sp. VK25D]MDX8548290.1 mechanosensitive ion channel family protein [Mesorhizobium sp. VK25A]
MVAWTAVIVVGYPLLTIALSEASRRTPQESGSDGARFLRVLQFAVLPAAVIWVLIHKLMSLPEQSFWIKIIDTIVGILVLYAVLLIAQAALFAVRSRINGRLTAPKLFYELGGLVIAVVGGAMIISAVWDVDLGTLFGALGVGSVVLGLALQNVIGGLANGLIVLSGRHFSIGDWLKVDGEFAKVVQVDWRSVTLENGDTRVVVPSSQLSSSTLRIRQGQQPRSVQVSLSFPAVHSPQKVKAALMEAAQSIEGGLPGTAHATADEISNGSIAYSVSIAVADPAAMTAVRAAMLERIWYVCRRRGLDSSNAGAEADETEIPRREQIFVRMAGLRGTVAGLNELAAAIRIERYAEGEYLQRHGEPAENIFILLSGDLSVTTGRGRVAVERLDAGQMFVIREMLRGAKSPVDLLAETESEVMNVPADAMQRMLDKNRGLAADFESAIETRTKLIGTVVTRERSQ